MADQPPSKELTQLLRDAHAYIYTMQWKDDGDHAVAQRICGELSRAIWQQPTPEPEARLPDTIDEIRARNQHAAERGNLTQAEFDTAWLLNYSAQPPVPERVERPTATKAGE